MARIRERSRQDGTTSFYVQWIEGGARGGDNMAERFTERAEAEAFKKLVDDAGQRTPTGWVKGRGFVEPSVPLHERKVPFRDWAEDYITHLTGVAGRTKGDYRRDVRLHMEPVFGDLDVRGTDEITPRVVAAWVNGLEAAGKKPKTIRNLHGVLSGILQSAVDHEPPLRPTNPCAKTRLPRVDHVDDEDGDDEDMTFLTPAEVMLIVAVIKEDARDLVRFLYGTGLRWGEAAALQVRDVDLLAKRPVLRVRRAWRRDEDGQPYLGPPKSKSSRRTILLSPALVDLLLPLVAGKRAKEFVFTHVDRRGNRAGLLEAAPWRYTTFREGRWLPALAQVQLCDTHRPKLARDRRRLLEPCGCPGTLEKRPGVHALRHSHVAALIAANVPMAAIRRRVGHDSFAMTDGVYGHMSPELDGVVADAVDAALQVQA